MALDLCMAAGTTEMCGGKESLSNVQARHLINVSRAHGQEDYAKISTNKNDQ